MGVFTLVNGETTPSESQATAAVVASSDELAPAARSSDPSEGPRATAGPRDDRVPPKIEAPPASAEPELEEDAAPPVPSATDAPPAAQPTRPSPPVRVRDDEDAVPPFDRAKAQGNIVAAQQQAKAHCFKLDGPRNFSATLTFRANGQLLVTGGFTGASGACVKSALGMARTGPFGPRNAPPQKMTASVLLPAKP